jgi:hypothetical protein
MKGKQYYTTLLAVLAATILVAILAVSAWARARYAINLGVSSVLDTSSTLMFCDGLMKWVVILALIGLAAYRDRGHK